MVRFVLLNPDGDCSDVNMPLKCKELEKPISTIIKKRVKNQKALVDVNEPKMVVLIMNYIINKGGTKLEEIAKWKLDEKEYCEDASLLSSSHSCYVVYTITDLKHGLSLVAGDNYDGKIYHQSPNGRSNAEWTLIPH